MARDAAGQSVQKRAPDAVASRPYFVQIAQPLIPQKGSVAIAKGEVVGNLKFEWKTQPLIPRKERFQNCEAGGNCKRGRILARDAAGQPIQKRAPDAEASRPYFVQIAQPLIPQKGSDAIAKREVVGNLKYEWIAKRLYPEKRVLQLPRGR